MGTLGESDKSTGRLYSSYFDLVQPKREGLRPGNYPLQALENPNGTEEPAAAASAHINAVLRSRGITTPYPQWNELPNVDGRQALALVRDAATAARR